MKATTHILSAFSLSLLWSLGTAQNLVPNPNFEDTLACPAHISDMNSVVGWSSCGYSPDYFHTCRDSTDVGVPLNAAGYQHPYSGDAYAGVITYHINNPIAREVICAELAQPLQINQLTYLSMRISPGAFGDYSYQGSSKYTSRGIGMMFSNQPINWPMPYPNDAALYLDSVLTDTAAWLLLSGTYMPDSAYQYVSIANFFEDSLSDLTVIDTNGVATAYVYVEDVCVSQQAGVCGIELTVMDQVSSNYQVVNPFSDQLQIVFPDGTDLSGLSLRLYDVMGRCVLQRGKLSNRRTVIATNHLPQGNFFLVLNSSKRTPSTTLTLLHVSP